MPIPVKNRSLTLSWISGIIPRDFSLYRGKTKSPNSIRKKNCWYVLNHLVSNEPIKNMIQSWGIYGGGQYFLIPDPTIEVFTIPVEICDN